MVETLISHSSLCEARTGNTSPSTQALRFGKCEMCGICDSCEGRKNATSIIHVDELCSWKHPEEAAHICTLEQQARWRGGTQHHPPADDALLFLCLDYFPEKIHVITGDGLAAVGISGTCARVN